MPTTPQKQEFSRRLIAFRDAVGMGQKEVGEMVGVSQGMVSYWEREQYIPDPDMVFTLEKVLEVEPGTLSSALGYVPLRAPLIVEAINEDKLLDADGRDVLLHTYNAAVAQTRLKRGRRQRGRARVQAVG